MTETSTLKGREKVLADAKSMRALFRKLRNGKEKRKVGINPEAFNALSGMQAEIFTFENYAFVVIPRDNQAEATYQAEWISARSYPN